MKATKYLSLAALALMGTLVCCQNDDEPANSFARPANAVGINVTVGSLQTTRSNPAATDPDEAHLFNQGDQVCVSTEGQDPVLFQCTNADQQTWAEAVSGKFLLWTQNEMTFKAYYPATTGTSMTTFTLPADQSTEANIALADYMTRQQTCTNVSGNNINLELERKTARVIVRIAGFNDQYDNDEKTVSNVRINSQYSAIANDNGNGDVTAVTPYQDGTGGLNTTYTALVVPGSGDDGADFITLTDAMNNTLKVKGIPELEAGNSYTFNLTVGKNTIQVQSVTVTDWTTGETLAGGQAQEQAAGVEGHALSASVVGEIVGTDGKAYAVADKDNLPSNVTAVAMIAYVSGSNGLAIALADEGSMNWATAKSTCEGKTAIGGNSWKLPTLDEWKQMFIANGGSEYSQSGLNTALAAAGGDNSKLKEGRYWTLTEVAGGAWNLEVGDGDVYWGSHDKSESYPVRACFAFTVEQAGAPTLNITSPAVGQVIGSDGKNYAYGSLPTGVTAVAKICYVSGSNGLALALTDEGKMDWSTAQTTCAAHTAPFTGGTWKLASKDEWDNMISAAGSYSALHDGFSSVGGTNMQPDYYWSSTEKDSDFAWYYDHDLEDWYSGDKEYDLYVRACLAFTVEQSAAEGHALSASAVGEIVGTDGKAYAVADKNNLPSGVTVAGLVAYKNGNSGLAIALTDEPNTMDWYEAMDDSGAKAHTPAVTGQTWKLPSYDDIEKMLSSYDNYWGDLNEAIANVGGTGLLDGWDNCYWLSDESDEESRYMIDLSSEEKTGPRDQYYLVRSVIDF